MNYPRIFHSLFSHRSHTPYPRLRVALSAALVFSAAVALPAASPTPAHALDNGLALTPPMGWNSWNFFGCNIDQWKIKGMADAMVSTGLRDAGYIYLNMDDCWQAAKRHPDGSLAWDLKRFPDGIPALARYVHSKGLKFGIYGNPGTKSCAEIYKGYQGAMGSYGHEYQDARTYATWGVDYLKYDWCRSERVTTGEKAFTLMRNALRATGRPIVYSIHYEPELPIPEWYPKVAHLWRTTPDIFDSWVSIAGITMMNIPQGKYAHPGGWNDPDMLEIGNGGLNWDQSLSHMALWSMMAAPLILGNDLRTLKSSDKRLLTDKVALRIDQDRLGKPVTVIRKSLQLVLLRQLSDGQWAVSFTNFGITPAHMSVTLKELGLSGDWHVREAFHFGQGPVKNQRLEATVPVHGSRLYLLTPMR